MPGLVAAGLTTEPKDVRDTVVVPAEREGFDKAFITANAWWAIGIAENDQVNLKWIVLGASGIRDHASSRLITSNPTVARESSRCTQRSRL